MANYYARKYGRRGRFSESGERRSVAKDKNQSRIDFADRAELLHELWQHFLHTSEHSNAAQNYLTSRGLNKDVVPVGFNNAMFHRSRPELIERAMEYGLLRQTRNMYYQTYGRMCVVFALRNIDDSIGGFYYRSIKHKHKYDKHYYLRNRKGLYPSYPARDTRRLMISESVIDAASVMMVPELRKEFTSLAIYGTSGFTAEHEFALKQLGQLEEVVLAMDGDKAGAAATIKIGRVIRGTCPDVDISDVMLPRGEDVNSILVSYGPDALTELVKQRRSIEHDLNAARYRRGA